MENKKGIFLTIIGGILMIIGSATGSAGLYALILNQIKLYVATEWEPLIGAIFTILRYIAIGGGYSVLVGVLLVILKQYWLGRFIIGIATSFGLLGLVTYILVWIIGYANISLDPSIQLVLDQVYNLFTFNSGLAFAGTVIAIIGRIGLKKPEVPTEEVAVPIIEERAPDMLDNLKNKYCPNCGTILPIHANFCSECGKDFD
ncbi:MAG: zinc ribbon domain-containing protein [Candidatus Hodarchaeota archaeon]